MNINSCLLFDENNTDQSGLESILSRWYDIVHIATDEPHPCKIHSSDELNGTILLGD